MRYSSPQLTAGYVPLVTEQHTINKVHLAIMVIQKNEAKHIKSSPNLTEPNTQLRTEWMFHLYQLSCVSSLVSSLLLTVIMTQPLQVKYIMQLILSWGIPVTFPMATPGPLFLTRLIQTTLSYTISVKEWSPLTSTLIWQLCLVTLKSWIDTWTWPWSQSVTFW